MSGEPSAYNDLRAVFINCTLKKSPSVSHTQGLIDKSIALMRSQGVTVDAIRFIDHAVATGVYPDMREHGWTDDAWPDEVWPVAPAADILVIGGPLWLGDNSSITRQLIERLYAMSGLFNDKGQYIYYGKTAGALITGNEDGVKHASMSILYSLQHIGYSIPPAADAGWIGEVGPGPSYLDPGSGGLENDFTNRNTTFMTWNLLHTARMHRGCGRWTASPSTRLGSTPSHAGVRIGGGRSAGLQQLRRVLEGSPDHRITPLPVARQAAFL